jgi:SAM-dependent methyltransferase
MIQSRDQIHEALRHRYAKVAEQPQGQFAYPVGRESAERLQYRRDFLDLVPPVLVEHFVGVGNPFSLGEPQPGWSVLDIGCGAGFDSQIAALYVGPTGKVIGVDLTEQMLAVARAGSVAAGVSNLQFRQGIAESLPVEPSSVDLVISNGVLNLATCKPTAFREVFRVLRPGGRFQAVDLVLVAELPEKLRNDQAAWSN